MGVQIAAYPYNGIILGNKNEWSIDTLRMNLKIIVQSEKSQNPPPLKGTYYMMLCI